jgi:hypothetical protein
VPFTAVLVGDFDGGIYIVADGKGEFEWKLGLFGLPFLIGTVVLVTIILNVLLGKTTVTLTKGKVRWGRICWGGGGSRSWSAGRGRR